MDAQREMTLDEWCEQLHPAHRVRKELATLRAHIEGLEARLATQTANALVLEARVRELEAKVEELDGLILQNGELDGPWW